MSNVREVQQARASSTKLATLVGKAGQLIVNKDTYAVHVMDGTTAGGTAMIGTAAQTLTEAQQEQVLENLGVFDALASLITEYGGTVPTE